MKVLLMLQFYHMSLFVFFYFLFYLKYGCFFVSCFCSSLYKCFVASQIKGNVLPKTYAFALVEQRQSNLLRVRMFLAGEVAHIDTDAMKSCKRLLSMRSLIASPLKPQEKPLFSLKVILVQYQLVLIHLSWDYSWGHLISNRQIFVSSLNLLVWGMKNRVSE